MAHEYRLPPSASTLTASMRDLGYSLGTAIADIIDNSISADAKNIQVFCLPFGDTPVLAIIDDGHGMNHEELLSAMRHGSCNPSEIRSSSDLGRFGLGLKTSSFSQCRQLTVVSRRGSTINGAEWDLDLVDRKDDWIITVLDEKEASKQPFADHIGEHGTIVIWRKLDRLFDGITGAAAEDIINEKLDIVEKHLSLVFHRFLAGEIKSRKISIAINNHPVRPFDPFCRNNKATQILPEEVVRINGSSVRIQPFILPHHSRLTAREYHYYQNRSDFLSNQGAYIYRNGRLMAWGDWFRLIPKGEATKLARVRIDFSNTLDEDWTIDIKKSRARPPHPVRERIKQIIAHISSRSTRVHRGRGRKLFEEISSPVWERYADQGAIRYSINREHPLVARLYKQLDDEGKKLFAVFLESVSSSLPIEMIYSDFSTSPREIRQDKELKPEEVYARLHSLREVLFGREQGDSDIFRETARSTRIFDNQMKTVEKYISEEMK